MICLKFSAGRGYVSYCARSNLLQIVPLGRRDWPEGWEEHTKLETEVPSQTPESPNRYMIATSVVISVLSATPMRRRLLLRSLPRKQGMLFQKPRATVKLPDPLFRKFRTENPGIRTLPVCTKLCAEMVRNRKERSLRKHSLDSMDL